MLSFFNNFFKGNQRTVKAKINIAYSFIIKGLSILVSLALVPLVLDYIDDERYGIWLTISSIITWFAFFDIGLGNGMRNKLSEAIAKNDFELARTYVSTTYVLLSGIFGIVLVLFFVINPLLNWQNILNTKSIESAELSVVVLIVFTFFVLNLLFKLIGKVFLADQRPAIQSTFDLIGKMLILLIIYILTILTEGSLLNLALVLSVVPVAVLIVVSIFFFTRDYKKYAPSIKYVDLSKSKDLIGLSVKFFIIQIAVIILFTTDNIIISQLYSPKEVTPYNISRKYFGIAQMIFSIIIIPFWSASTEAFVKNDYSWIKKIIKKLFFIWLLFLIIIVLMYIFSGYFFKIWIGDRVIISSDLSLGWALFISVNLFGALISQFINGSGKIKISILTAIVNILINIPLSVFLARNLNMGLFGVILATTICISISIVIRTIQLNKIINNKDYGIWSQ